MADKNNDALPEGTDKIVTGASGGPAKTRVLVPEREVAAAESRLAERVRSGADKLSNQAGEKARSAEALANVSKRVGDTAPGIEDRLGTEYGDYARRAASAIESTANAIAEKDPDELIEDTRNFVRNSPGIALAGAAVVGFVLARLFKTGLARDGDDED